MRPTDASAAIPSAGSQEARPKPGKKSTGRTKEMTRTTLPNIPGTAASVAWTTLRGDCPAPRVERNLRGLERLQQRRNPRDDRSRSGAILPKLWLRNDGGFKVTARQRADRCQSRRGFESGQRQVQHQGGCQQAQRPGCSHSAASAVRQG